MNNEKEFNRRLGASLRHYREHLGFTQQEIADKLDVSKMAVSNWESGNRSIYAVKLRDYCDAIGISMVDVLEHL